MLQYICNTIVVAKKMTDSRETRVIPGVRNSTVLSTPNVGYPPNNC